MTPLSKEQHDRLVEVANKRFFNRLEMYELYLWLDNFKPEEYELAIALLEHIDFYREKDFVSLLAIAISELSTDKKSIRFHFLPIGKPGKSGDIVVYQLHKLFAQSEIKAVVYNYASEIALEALNENDYLVLVDDFIGSGNTVDTFIQTIPNKESLLSYPQLSIICGVIMKNGLGLLNRKYTKPYGVSIHAGDIKNRAFEKGLSPFGGYIRMKRMRDFCYKYGVCLSRHFPLGYKNTQSLVIIEHTSPNDSIPILWSNKLYKGKPWIPLAPRNYPIVVERAAIDRQENNRWISKLKSILDAESDEDVKRTFSGENYTIILILRLLMRGKPESVIANTLGLTFEDMQEVKKKGVTLGFWDDDWEVDAFAKKQYEEAVDYFKRQKREKRENDDELEDERNMIFVPETFRNLK